MPPSEATSQYPWSSLVAVMVTIGWLSGRPAAEPRAAALPKFHTVPCASASQKLSDGNARRRMDTLGRGAGAGHRGRAEPDGHERQRTDGQTGRDGGERAGSAPAREAASTGRG